MSAHQTHKEHSWCI